MKPFARSLPLFAAIALRSFTNAEVVSLTPENYAELTAGKAVFIKFFAPWCGHCKAMAGDYEQLASAHESSTEKLIAEVDCTDEEGGGDALCSENGVQGFPTLKYGNPSALSDYEGGRDFDSMNDFVSTELKLSCSPYNLDLCSDEEKEMIETVMKMDDAAIQEEIEKVDGIVKEAEDALQKGIEGLQERFEKMMNEHEEKLDALKEESNYTLKKAVLSMKKKEAGGSDEL